MFDSFLCMKERTEAQLKLIELNKQFITEIENGKGWSDVKYLLEDDDQEDIWVCLTCWNEETKKN